jgi:transcriptional regulator with XRE-family HTH domain
MPPSSPTARLRKLGRELRAHRERVGLSSEAAAKRLGWSQSRVSRFETARALPTVTEVSHMLDTYGVDSGTRATLIQLTRQAQEPGWWVPYGDIFTGSYISFEDVARKIRILELSLIPGLLQSGRYARALIEAARLGDAADVERRVVARLARQGAVLTRSDAPDLLAILDEAALRRPVGGPDVMREQLRALLPSRDRPNVAVRVLPFSAGAHAGMDGPFTILSFQGDPDLAYVESRAGNNYLESVDQMRGVTLTFERVTEDALTVEESAAFIAALIEE